MKCYNHQTRDAVGICRRCGKGLCSECATSGDAGLTCRADCAPLQGTAQRLNSSGTSAGSTPNYSMFIYVAIILAIIFLPKYLPTKDSSRPRGSSATPRQTMYDRAELGIENTFFMDTTILQTRNIYFNYDFNELTCGWLIKTLWLLDSKSSEPINLYLCSSGGFISEAIAVENTLKSLNSKVNTYATGYCASSALRTLASGTGTRAAYCNSILMFHGKDYESSVGERSYDAVAKNTERKDWLRISKMPEEMLSDTTDLHMSPEKALELGFVDTVLCF